jgi:hypothetical protein
MPAFDAHPLLILVFACAVLPLLAEDTRYPTLRWQGWQLLLYALGVAGTAWLLRQAPALQGPMPAGLEAWPWLLTQVLAPLLLLQLYRRFSPAPRPGLDLWLVLLPLPLFWSRPELWGGHWPGLLSTELRVLAIGVASWLVLALLIGAGEKCRLNRQPEALAGLPFRLMVVASLLLLAKGVESLLAGRLP